MRRISLILTAAMLGGCGGGYILTAPDAAALAGKDAPVVVRLQRREVWRYAPSQAGAAVMFRLGEDSPQCARTDKAGYAALSIKSPQKPGRYDVAMYHQDINGDSVTGKAAIYVLDPDRPIAAVDMDSLPMNDKGAGQAAGAIVRMQSAAQVIYVTEKYASSPARAHEMLEDHGYPDGPVAPYGKSRRWWKWRRGGKANALEELCGRFAKLRRGVTADAAAAGAFAQVGMEVMFVGKKEVADAKIFDSWADVKIISSE